MANRRFRRRHHKAVGGVAKQSLIAQFDLVAEPGTIDDRRSQSISPGATPARASAIHWPDNRHRRHQPARVV
ncbi:MAG: hypothetical protein R3C40_12325 [Parvularculaceae bacterium]